MNARPTGRPPGDERSFWSMVGGDLHKWGENASAIHKIAAVLIPLLLAAVWVYGVLPLPHEVHRQAVRLDTLEAWRALDTAIVTQPVQQELDSLGRRMNRLRQSLQSLDSTNRTGFARVEEIYQTLREVRWQQCRQLRASHLVTYPCRSDKEGS